jgi:hypothetical protein
MPTQLGQCFVPHEGELQACADQIAGALGASVARLYDNNHVFNPADTCADYNEASFVGYSPVTPIAWGSPFLNVDGKAETDSPTLTFAFTAGLGTAVVFGLYLTDPGQTKLLRVIPFLFPVTLSPAAPTLALVLQLTDASEL